MRARGANCTDIAVLVVAADDGVMPQTEEAISHAKAAGVPIVVALNKMDLPGVSRDRVVQELASNDLMPSEWGGDVEIVETSAVTGQGIDTLMETLLMVAELHELKARPDRPAMGVAIESSLQPGQGVLCTLLVQNGTLHDGDIVLCGNAYGKVRAMFDTLDPTRELTEAPPSTPVSVLGLDVAPGAGSSFVVLDDISVARQIAEERTQIIHQRELSGGEAHVTLESLKARLDSKTQQTLNIIIRTDVRGSIEAIRKELSKLDHPEVKIKILQASVGGITEADVLLADASDANGIGSAAFAPSTPIAASKRATEAGSASCTAPVASAAGTCCAAVPAARTASTIMDSVISSSPLQVLPPPGLRCLPQPPQAEPLPRKFCPSSRAPFP